MFVTTNSEGETAFDDGVIGRIAGVLQRARRQQRVMCRVECNGAEFFPVTNHRLLCQNFVECNFALQGVSCAVPSFTHWYLTSRN